MTEKPMEQNPTPEVSWSRDVYPKLPLFKVPSGSSLPKEALSLLEFVAEDPATENRVVVRHINWAFQLTPIPGGKNAVIRKTQTMSSHRVYTRDDGTVYLGDAAQTFRVYMNEHQYTLEEANNEMLRM